MSVLDIAQQAAGIEQQSGKSNKAFPVPREGAALFRMCSYIELGKEETEWQGNKKVVTKVLIEFELSHPDHIVEGEKKDGGKYRIVPKVQVRLNKSSSDLSGYMKLYKALNYNGEYAGKKPTLAQFLGKPFFGAIHHNKAKTGDKVYVNISKDGAYTIGAPRVPKTDPTTGLPVPGEFNEIPVPELSNEPRLFIFGDANSTPEKINAMWDSLFIDGKNWIQDSIKKSIGFAETAEGEVISGATAALESAVEAIGNEPEAKPEPKPEPKVEEPTADDDPLAGLGI
jgi:hypothetical protein